MNQLDHVLTLYTSATCGFCVAAKRFLDAAGVAYRERAVDQDVEAAREMVALTGQYGVPVVRKDARYVVGFDPEAILRLVMDLDRLEMASG